MVKDIPEPTQAGGDGSALQPIVGGLTDSDYQEGSYEEEEEVMDVEEEEEEDEDEINDAGLLRSMLRESEVYYANRAADEAREEKHCWVCFATEEDDPHASWSHPCK